MKKFLFTLALLACTFQVQAQSTIYFSATLTGTDEVPPNNDPTVAAGTFSLNGNVLNFFLDVPAITFIAHNAYIQGPAMPGASAPIIFDLGGPTFRPGNDFGTPPGYRFFSPFTDPFGAGPFTLSDDQISQLMGGLWYVNVTAANYPDGIIRGQILPVPEPSTLALLVLGTGALVLLAKRPRKPRNALHGGLTMLSLCVLFSLSEASVKAFPFWPDGPINRATNVYELPPGLSAIANPLLHRIGTRMGDSRIDNTVGTLFPRMPHGTILYKFDAETQRFTANRFGAHGWSQPAETLNPGEGALLFNPTRRLLRVSVTGDYWNFGLRITLPTGFSLMAFPGIVFDLRTSQSGGPFFIWDNRYFDPHDGDIVLTLDRGCGAFVPHTFQNGEWDVVPVVSDTEAFYVWTSVARVIENKDPVPE